MSTVRSCLAHVVPSGATTAQGLETLRSQCWHEKGIVVLNVEEVADDWLRQALKNEATKRWGKRMRR